MSGGLQDDTQKGSQQRRQATPLLNGRDLVVTAIILLVCVFLYYTTTQFEEVSDLLGQNVLPEQFPRLLLYIIAGLSLLLPIEHHLQPKRWEKIDRTRSKKIASRTWQTIGFILFVVLAAPVLGTVLTMVVICVALPILWGETRWVVIMLFAVIFTAIVTYLFSSVLKVYFEPGLLGSILSMFNA